LVFPSSYSSSIQDVIISYHSLLGRPSISIHPFRSAPCHYIFQPDLLEFDENSSFNRSRNVTSSSTLSLKSSRPTSRFTKPRFPNKCRVGLHFDAPEYDPSKAIICLDNPKHAYGLSVRQMAALGLTDDQVQKKFEVELVAPPFFHYPLP